MDKKLTAGPIGVFDSGFGGLTVFKEIQKALPQYDYIYLGDNARVPYGTKSFQTVYEYTKECVFKLFDLGCNLVILACNTASAKALRSIQQHDLPPGKKVLGVIRPTTEIIGSLTKTKKVGILATTGTVKSNSYPIEIQKFSPEVEVFQQDCPFWVPLVENNEIDSDGARYYIKKDIEAIFEKSNAIDTLLLACTHYPILLPLIQEFVPAGINIISQGQIVADSLVEYLQRHPEVEELCSKQCNLKFYTTDQASDFEEKANIFYGKPILAENITV
ncbi:glutamate racemase [Sphingobacterium hungaricum]|uniref:Glutamate racemase n=1 Tax=Sphingobacterium hungaricum TaxID=2082723 RepID=A0A928UXJ7_9SPHI|nr:glutamate racemase [Sphingobacterium hungaricum]MBE8714532.1 glutamate racemase [Sphingobacterium hungaricum]